MSTADTPDGRASYIQGAINGTLTYIERALVATDVNDPTKAASDMRQARGRVRATLTHTLALRDILATPEGPIPATPKVSTSDVGYDSMLVYGSKFIP